jgi:leader peptidase (prepilin peptidase)/N-methyltransferase
MSPSIVAFAAVFGGAASAFVPRVADRLAVPSGTPARSACAACARPFPGWVRAGAPCPCKRPPWHTVLATALAAGLLGIVVDVSAALPPLLVAVVLAALLAEIDIRCLRLPDRLVGALAFVLVMASVAEWASVGGAGLAVGWALVGGAGLAAAIVGLGHLVVAVLAGGGLGLGDVKLAAVLAFALGLTGWPTVLLGVLVPYLINGPIAVYLLLSRRATRRTPLPFGPALLAGALIAFAASDT